MIDQAKLLRFAPHAWEGYVTALVNGSADLEAAGINTPLRLSHFLAQCAHESMGFTVTRENTGWSGEQMKRLWPARFRLGAADPRIIAARGDEEKLANLVYGKEGYRYRGGGIIQLTGRDNYAACGAAIGIDLETYPELIEDPVVALKAACWFWIINDLNRFADRNYGRAIGNAINRGNPFSAHEPIGAADRQKWFKWAWGIFGEGQQLPSQDTLYLGASGRKVLQVQTRLRDLGYAVGALDGVFGPAMARAVGGAKMDIRRRAGPRVDLEPEEGVGPLTCAALEEADPAPLSPERLQATEKDLAATSTTVQAGRRAKAAGQAALYTGLAAGADKAGVLDVLSGWSSQISGLHVTIAPALAAMQWGLKHALWLLLILGGVWGWIAFRDVILARLTAHRNGANLSR